MKVRIVNDGQHGRFTQVTNADTGEMIEQVIEADVSLHIGVHDIPTAIITTFCPSIDVIADAEIRQICPWCGKPTDAQRVTLPEPMEVSIVGVIQNLVNAVLMAYQRDSSAERDTEQPTRHPAYDL